MYRVGFSSHRYSTTKNILKFETNIAGSTDRDPLTNYRIYIKMREVFLIRRD
jgi:hypothetical protein